MMDFVIAKTENREQGLAQELTPSRKLPDLPPSATLETKEIFKALIETHRSLAELKTLSTMIPNAEILLDTLVLQEAKASSEIEGIITTNDELFQADSFFEKAQKAETKEVMRYREILKYGHTQMSKMHNIISGKTLVEMFRILLKRDDGFRKTPRTVIKDMADGEIVYVPPQEPEEIVRLMGALERFVNRDDECSLDPLVKMALIHHQFESIHPFPDGNGRIGRILNILYLVHTGLLTVPILYLSRYLIRTRSTYYRLLREVNDTNGISEVWEKWVLYMLTAVRETSVTTIELATGIRDQMTKIKRDLRSKKSKIYNQGLLDTIFRHPYTSIYQVENDLNVTRQTAGKYLDELANYGILEKRRSGRRSYYINLELVELLTNIN